MEKWIISPGQGGYNPHSAVDAYRSPYCSMSTMLTAVPNYMPSGKSAIQVQS